MWYQGLLRFSSTWSWAVFRNARRPFWPRTHTTFVVTRNKAAGKLYARYLSQKPRYVCTVGVILSYQNLFFVFIPSRKLKNKMSILHFFKSESRKIKFIAIAFQLISRSVTMGKMPCLRSPKMLNSFWDRFWLANKIFSQSKFKIQNSKCFSL